MYTRRKQRIRPRGGDVYLHDVAANLRGDLRHICVDEGIIRNLMTPRMKKVADPENQPGQEQYRADQRYQRAIEQIRMHKPDLSPLEHACTSSTSSHGGG